MIRKLIRLCLALLGSGVIGTICFALIFVDPSQYLTLLMIATPIVLLLALVLGGGIYALLLILRVQLTLLTCVMVGALLGAIPGLILWLTAQSPSPDWSATNELAKAVWQPLIFGAFGVVGGFAFALFTRLLKLR